MSPRESAFDENLSRGYGRDGRHPHEGAGEHRGRRSRGPVNARTEESGKAFAAEWGILHYSTSLEESIDRPGVDAVILTTPSSMHADQTVMALARASTSRSRSR